MENYEEFKSRRLEELAKLPPHKDYEQPPGMYIPLGDVVTVMECEQTEYKTRAGILIPGVGQLEHARIGWVVNKGELCQLPVKEGDTIAFDKSCNFGINYQGKNYLRVPSYQVFFVVPPDTYLEPHYADFFEKRRQSRIAGEKTVRKRDNDNLEEKFEKRDEQNRKKDYIEGKPSDNKTIFKENSSTA
jgi:co-chaperonin GroES (HSP10)